MDAKHSRLSLLADTGAILAILDKKDVWHKACAGVFLGLDSPMLTSEAVLTELFHLAARSRIQIQTAWGFIHSGALALGSILDDDLPAIHQLMTQYADRPMDFADATLVHLARRESMTTILTIDHDDFSTYRIEGKRRFRILPEKQP